jgi:hypothetical protein
MSKLTGIVSLAGVICLIFGSALAQSQSSVSETAESRAVEAPEEASCPVSEVAGRPSSLGVCIGDRGCLRGAVVEPVGGEGMREAGTYEAVQVGHVMDVPSRISQLNGVGAAIHPLHANFHGGPPVWDWEDQATHRGLGAQERQP